MGKPITQPSLKISKKESNNQFNSRVKVLKPKVYITHSSDFKALVQKVTGNGSPSLPVSSFSPPTAVPMVSTQPPHVIHIDDYGSPDPSLDRSPDPSMDNTFMSFDYSYCSSTEELGLSSTISSFSHPMHVVSSEPAQVIHIDDHDSPDPSSDNTFIPSDYSYCSTEEFGVQWPQDHALDYVDEIQLRNLESWLLDFDPSACILEGPSMPMNTYEYGYNLSIM
ncbi:hypothetical protein L2E82_07992 [Cichorium intybus]|uniref:Uncharacterized protein n=1 Tax=Cichorium intybus TaxID=13427 RepID=A0ACB9G5X7_CICIN|nr:hypothetical protein L2E82_07992 [Cichorium intybus]